MSKKALIVEDDELVRDLLCDQLKGCGFDVTSAIDGEKGGVCHENGYRAYSLAIETERFCFVVRRGTRASEIKHLRPDEAAEVLTIFIRRKSKWQFCWPDSSVFSKKVSRPA